MSFINFLKGFNEGRKLFNEVISMLINAILLTLVYFLGVGLTYIFAKVIRKRFLDLGIDNETLTYWEELNIGERPVKEYYRQF